MHSPEPMVVLPTRSASERIPSRDSVYDPSQPYNICGTVRHAPNPQPGRCGVAHSAGSVPPPYAHLHAAGVASAERGFPREPYARNHVPLLDWNAHLRSEAMGSPAWYQASMPPARTETVGKCCSR